MVLFQIYLDTKKFSRGWGQGVVWWSPGMEGSVSKVGAGVSTSLGRQDYGCWVLAKETRAQKQIRRWMYGPATRMCPEPRVRVHPVLCPWDPGTYVHKEGTELPWKLENELGFLLRTYGIPHSCHEKKTTASQCTSEKGKGCKYGAQGPISGVGGRAPGWIQMQNHKDKKSEKQNRQTEEKEPQGQRSDKRSVAPPRAPRPGGAKGRLPTDKCSQTATKKKIYTWVYTTQTITGSFFTHNHHLSCY